MKEFFRGRLTEEQREAQLRRILVVETNIMLPVKVIAILAAIHFYRVMIAAPAAPVALPVYFAQLNFYGAGNLIFWVLLVAARLGTMWPRILRFSAFWLAMLDNLFLSGLIYSTAGLDSPLYWLYIGLFIRSAVDFPVFWQQTALNLGACLFYTIAVMLSEETLQFFGEELYWLRLVVLLLLGVCCWGVYVLLERERRRALVQQEIQLRAHKAAAAGRLAAEIAHQLKNPLGIINNAAYLLQKQAESNGAPPDDAIVVIREEVSRSDKILTQLMNYARLSEGRIEPVDLNEVLDQALAQVEPTGLMTKINVVRDYAPWLAKVPAQRAELAECFLNLIQNAVEAMAAGGTLTVRSRYAGKERIEIELADTGPGIAPDVLPRVFEAFFTTKPAGTGLGLAIVKNVIETYDGTIGVESAPGRGTRFRVLLPTQISR